MRAILLAGGLSLIFTLLGTRVAIRVLTTKGYGQLIRDDGPTTHHTKRGTPTMGGLVIILSVVLAYFVAKLITQDVPSWSGLLLLFLLVGLGTVGFLDDYIKIAKQRSLGLRSKAKIAGQTLVAVVFGVLALTSARRARPDPRVAAPVVHPRLRELHASRRRRRAADPGDDLRVEQRGEPHRRAGRPRHRRLDDGVRRLHAGEHLAEQPVVRAQPRATSATTCATRSTSPPSPPRSPAPASASCGGTPRRPRSSWATPARSRSAARWPGLAILTRTEFLLAVLGGLFVIQTLSVILQVGYFKLTGGRRMFRMAPLHHHFELKGWDEITVVIRFWIITGICVAAGLGHLLRRVGRRRMSRSHDRSTPLGRHDSRGTGVRAVVRRHRGLRLRGRRQPDPPRRARSPCSPSPPTDVQREKATLLEMLGATVRIGAGATRDAARRRRPAGHVAGRAADRAADRRGGRDRGVPVWGEVELAWRLRDPEHPGAWLCVTGTNGKTTTVQMLDTILRGGRRAQHRLRQRRPADRGGGDGPGAVRRLRRRAVQLPAALHLVDVGALRRRAQRRGGPPRLVRPRWSDYAADKGRIYERVQHGLRLQRRRPGHRAAGPRRRGRRGRPRDRLHPRHPRRRHGRRRRGRAGRPRVRRGARAQRRRAVHRRRPGLAGAALRRQRPRRRGAGPLDGVPHRRGARRAARRSRPTATGSPTSAEVDGVRYVDDSKATNPHAATSSLQAYDPVVWVAGGLAKGAHVRRAGAAVCVDRLRGVVLLGRDRAVIAEALSRHAPDVPVIEVEGGDTSVMDRVVGAAAELAQPGDTVLLAPGCASMDMFANYGARGDAFAEAVRRLARPLSDRSADHAATRRATA